MAALYLMLPCFIVSVLCMRSRVIITGTTVGPGLKIPSGKCKSDDARLVHVLARSREDFKGDFASSNKVKE